MALAACALPIEPAESGVTAPERFVAGAAVPAAAPAPDPAWWREFGAPDLDRIMAAAMEGNLDLAAATARLRQADETLRIAGAQLLPLVEGSVSVGRARGTSRIDQNLQDARTAMAWDEDAWYIGVRGPTRPTPSVYRDGIAKLRAFNASLEKCQATFDARADNLLQFLDRIAGDMGSTSDILRSQIEASDAGWFDPRADDRFWFAYGQLYAYYGILSATREDFSSVIRERNLATLWDTMQTQMRDALNMQPWIISNGNESSFLFPSHLATMGFNLLRARSQIVEIRSVLDR